jgi:hypothetical protein
MKLSNFKRITFFSILFFTIILGRAQFVTVDGNCGFMLNGQPFKVLVCNYKAAIDWDYNTGAYYMGPASYYSDQWGYPDTWGNSSNNPNYGWGTWYFALTNNKLVSEAKLQNDLNKMASLGFTAVRFCPFVPIVSGIPCGNMTTYFQMVDQFMTKAQNAGLKVIYLLGGDPADVSYKSFIRQVADYYKNSTTIMAYDLWNEPFGTMACNSEFSKYAATKLVSEWNSAVKCKDVNHLTTIGLQSPVDVAIFDAQNISVDFISFHEYYGGGRSASLASAKSHFDKFTYWAGKTIKVPWIIGETSYPAFGPTDNNSLVSCDNIHIGNQTDMKGFADYSLQRSVDCNCKGYSWWQYQNCTEACPQGSGSNSASSSNFMGLYQKYNNGIETPKTIVDPANGPSPFSSYGGLQQNTCSFPQDYYRGFSGSATTPALVGTVVDELGQPIEHAVAFCKDATNWSWHTAFSNASGVFQVYLSGTQTVGSLELSTPGYSTIYISPPNTPANNQTYVLKKVNKNGWVKEGDNGLTPGKLKAMTGTGTDWTLNNSDKFYKGDFNNDGIQDLLCVQNTGGPSDRIAILTYTTTLTNTGNGIHNIKGDWKILWDNKAGSNDINAGGLYPYRNNLVIGDFNGDGTDDIFGITNSWITWFTFTGSTSGFTWMDSNYGVTDTKPGMTSMKMYVQSGKVYAGNFFGGARDAIICVNGSNSIDAFEVSTSGTYQGKWIYKSTITSMFSNYSSIAQMIPADFDADGVDELLINQSLVPNASGRIGILKHNVNTNSWSELWADASNSSGIYPYRGNLVVGNYMKDDGAEILGIEGTWCASFDYSNGNISWQGTFNNQISDWSIPAGSATYNKYMFLNTDVNMSRQVGPTTNFFQHLLALRNANNVFQANLYSFRPNLSTYTPCSTSRLAGHGTNEEVKETESSFHTLTVFPNPNNGSFSIGISGINPKESKLSIFDMQGREIAYQSELGGDNSLKLSMEHASKGVYFVKLISNEKIYTGKLTVL